LNFNIKNLVLLKKQSYLCNRINRIKINTMKTIFDRSVIVAIILASGAIKAISQPVYKINPPGSNLVIKGTSSMHDWTMEADNIKCSFEMDLANNSIESLTGINFSVAVKDIKSESNLMDKKAHEALKSDKSPVITFAQTAPAVLTSASAGTISGKVTGNLSVAGKSKRVEISFTGRISGDKLIVTGTLPVKMSEFEIEPPTAMLGALKTGDAVTLSYSFEFVPGVISD